MTSDLDIRFPGIAILTTDRRSTRFVRTDIMLDAIGSGTLFFSVYRCRIRMVYGGGEISRKLVRD
jgi:hypothetical protein